MKQANKITWQTGRPRIRLAGLECRRVIWVFCFLQEPLEAISKSFSCHPEQSEGSQSLKNGRFFAALRMTFSPKGGFATGSRNSTWGKGRVRRAYHAGNCKEQGGFKTHPYPAIFGPQGGKSDFRAWWGKQVQGGPGADQLPPAARRRIKYRVPKAWGSRRCRTMS
jgi:hypothetical protein